MSDNAYYRYENQQMCWKPEDGGYRKCNSGDAIDDTNVNTDTFFRMPGRFLYEPLIFKKTRRTYKRVAGVQDWGYIADEGFGEGMLNLTLDMMDLSMMAYLFKGCTTTGPVSSVYTHTYISTTARTVPPPSFCILFVMTNNDTDNSIVKLYTGCELVSAPSITGGTDQNTLSLQLEIKFANCVTGTALNSYPSFGTLKNYTFDRTSVTYTKGGVAYAGGCHGFDIRLNDGTVLHKEADDLYPSEAMNGDRDFGLMLDWAPKQIEAVDDTLISPLGASTASDLDITIKAYRDPDDDYTQFAFEKLWCHNAPDVNWDWELQGTRFASQKPEFIIKPTEYESGAKLTTTEKNLLNGDRY